MHSIWRVRGLWLGQGVSERAVCVVWAVCLGLCENHNVWKLRFCGGGGDGRVTQGEHLC
jgi:hypothetical protein